MSAPQIVECRIINRTTQNGTGGDPTKPYRFSEILMRDENDEHYCSRTWEDIADSPFNRSHQIAQFKQRWEAAERARR